MFVNVIVFANAELKVRLRRDEDGERGQMVTLSNGIFYSALKVSLWDMMM